MLVMRRSGADRSTFLDTWETHVLLRDDAEIGRIEICAPGRHPIQGHVTVQGSQFQCRIHATAKPRLAFVPARWVMYDGDSELHSARPEGARTFLVDEAPGLGLLRLRREGVLGHGFAIDRMPDEERIGQVTFLRGRLVPRPRAPQYQLETTRALPDTFEIFLAWIVVQSGLDVG
jgi:hypothetical protein